MPEFSIRIVKVGGGAGFQPDIPGDKPGDTLFVPPYSLVSWNNQTDVPHTVKMDDGSYTSEEILPTLSTKTDYYAPANDGPVTYRCATHPGEKGTITVKSPVKIDPITL